MKRFGEIKPLERLINSDSLSNLHVVVKDVQELNNFPNDAVALFGEDSGEYRKGDVVVRTDGVWKKLQQIKQGIDPATRLRVRRFGRKVIIKWSDPNDRYDKDGNLLSEFFRSIVVRKLGSAPLNEFDGTQIYINYKRNQYSGRDKKPYLEDTLPEGDGIGRWFYRVFSSNKEGIVNRNSEYAEALELDWEGIHTLIQEGYSNRVFTTGDEIALNDGNALVVAGFDTVRVKNAVEIPHTVTFITKYPVAILPFDFAKGIYRLTNDKQAIANKNYYFIDDNGNVKRKAFAINAVIPAGGYYEMQSASRGENGNNRWSISDIRLWLNQTSEAAYSAIVNKFKENVPTLPKPPLEQITESLGEEFTKMIISQIVFTASSTTDNTNVTLNQTEDKFFIPSVTELYAALTNKYKEGTQFEGFFNGETPKGFPDCSDWSAEMEEHRQAGVPVMTRSVMSAIPGQTDLGINIVAETKEGKADKTVFATAGTMMAVRYMFSIG